MNKRTIAQMMLIFAALAFIIVNILAATKDAPTEAIIENSGYKPDQKGSVKLSHKKHNIDFKVACTDCHHEYKDGKNIWKEGLPVQKCSACHDLKETKGKNQKLQLAYHSNCKECHKLKKKGPVDTCTECHAKKG